MSQCEEIGCPDEAHWLLDGRYFCDDHYEANRPRLLRELNEENSKLRAEVEELQNMLSMKRRLEMEAELATLRAEVKQTHLANIELAGRIHLLKQENERLKEWVPKQGDSVIATKFGIQEAELARLRQENERLRNSKMVMAGLVDEVRTERDQLRKEVERLKQRATDVGVAVENLKSIKDAAWAEIARLRDPERIAGMIRERLPELFMRCGLLVPYGEDRVMLQDAIARDLAETICKGKAQ